MFFDNYVFFNWIFAMSLPADKENESPNLPGKVCVVESRLDDNELLSD